MRLSVRRHEARLVAVSAAARARAATSGTRAGQRTIIGVWNFLIVVSLVAWLLPLAVQHHLAPDLVALVLLAGVFLIAQGLGVLLRAVLAAVALCALARQFGWDAIMQLLPLFVVAFGYFVMFGGLRRRVGR